MATTPPTRPADKALPVKEVAAAVKTAALEGAAAAAWTEAAAAVRQDAQAARDAKLLEDRIAVLTPAIKRAQHAFRKFSSSAYTKHKQPVNYLKPGAAIVPMLQDAMTRGVDTMRRSGPRRSLRIKKTSGFDALVQNTEDGGNGRIDLGQLHGYLENSGAGVQLSIDTTPTPMSLCKAQIEAARIISQVKGGGAPAPPAAGKGDLEEGDDDRGGTVAADQLTEIAAQVVKDGVSLQMSTATSPETALSYPLADRSKEASELQDKIQTFELRSGPADVTAYHDFHSLQIAFEDIWTELLDGDLKAFGQQLYAKYVELGQRLQVDAPLHDINTLDDLRNLMTEIQSLSGLVPPPPQDAFNAVSTLIGGLFGAIPNPNPPPSAASIADTSRLAQLLTGLENRLKGKYLFKVFAENSINFGVLTTYRQTWEPLTYQVGELVTTVPLAPKEVRKYTVRSLRKKTRAVKELDDALRVRRKEESDTARVDAEIVEKAQNRTNFNITAHESIGSQSGPYAIDSSQASNQEQGKQSERIKKEIRENVLKSAEEYRQQNRKEIETTSIDETETTSVQEIQNPNDELPVTYLFYELQRRYKVSERLHALTPVVLVANKVPLPSGITDAWLVEHDWILKRVILDDSFRQALDYLSTSFVGDEINIRVLEDNAAVQRDLVNTLKQQLETQNQLISAENQAITDAVKNAQQGMETQSLVAAVHTIFDPLGVTQTPDIGRATALQAQVDYTKEQLERAEKQRRKLESDLQIAATALQGAIDKLAMAVKEHFNKLTSVDRLRVHVKENIIYYMQAIWSHEPPDQRYFRLYDLDVPVIVAQMNGVIIDLDGSTIPAWRSADGQFVAGKLPIPPNVGFEFRKLADIADLDTLLGYKGNYMIFPLKTNNYLTWHMMQDYLELGDELRLRDPDEFANYTLEEIQELAACYYQKNKDTFKNQEPQFTQEIISRLLSTRKESDIVVVPTSSLYIEALVGTHTLLEDFKQIHRALDVKKVQAEVRHAELENIRLASRALKGKDGDPDVEKKVVIEAAASSIALQPEV